MAYIGILHPNAKEFLKNDYMGKLRLGRMM